MKRILVIDDNEENRYYLEKLLTSSNYDVISCKDGYEAYETLLQQNKLDLIISDILMPRMDGFMLCYSVKNNSKTKKIPFIFYTATYTSDLDIKFGYSLGAIKYLIKPLIPDQILDEISDIFDNPTLLENNRLSSKQTSEEILTLYNDRLFNKLNKKILELEDEIKLRKEIEKELREIKQKEIQTEKVKTINHFAIGMAHDLNNILSTITLTSNIIIDGDFDDEIKEYMKPVLQSTEIAKNLIADLNNLSKSKEFEYNPVDLNQTIKLNETNLNNIFGKNYQLEFDLTDSNSIILGNENHIYLILFNLLLNAKQAMPKGGEIYISTCKYSNNIEVDSQKKNYIQLIVRDNGVGIPDNIINHVFEPFFSTKFGTGTGMGLTIVQNYVTAMNAEIKVKSKINEGTEFTLVFQLLNDNY
jgi:signal transduction histidine kinase